MLFDRFKQVKAFVFVLDGALADGKIWLTERGERLRRLDRKDDYAIQLALQRNYPIAVISDGHALGIRKGMEEIGVQDLFSGRGDQRTGLLDWLSRRKVAAGDMLYMGSDMPDVDCMRIAGLPACSADAVEEIKASATYISSCKGGDGAVRDVIEKVMKLQGTWV